MSSLDKIHPPSIELEKGSIHPVNQTKDFLVAFLRDLGFQEVKGP